jgi:hypothetical protein
MIMNDKLGTMCNEVVVPYLRELYQYVPRRAKKVIKYLTVKSAVFWVVTL